MQNLSIKLKDSNGNNITKEIIDFNIEDYVIPGADHELNRLVLFRYKVSGDIEGRRYEFLLREKCPVKFIEDVFAQLYVHDGSRGEGA